MSERATIYSSATGKVISFYQGIAGSAAAQELPAGADLLIEDATGFASPYVDLSGPDPVIAERPAMGATISGMTISQIPPGAVLTIEGVDYTINDGEAELSFNAPGTYTVRLSLWPRLDQSFEVIAP